MKEKIKQQKGVIQIPLLIGIIVASVILGAVIGYKMIPLSNITTQFTTTTIATTITTQPTVITDWSCGDSVTFTYKGDIVTYGTVESQGRCWMDRNLGASRVAITYNDFEAQGDLFQ